MIRMALICRARWVLLWVAVACRKRCGCSGPLVARLQRQQGALRQFCVASRVPGPWARWAVSRWPGRPRRAMLAPAEVQIGRKRRQERGRARTGYAPGAQKSRACSCAIALTAVATGACPSAPRVAAVGSGAQPHGNGLLSATRVCVCVCVCGGGAWCATPQDHTTVRVCVSWTRMPLDSRQGTFSAGRDLRWAPPKHAPAWA